MAEANDREGSSDMESNSFVPVELVDERKVEKRPSDKVFIYLILLIYGCLVAMLYSEEQQEHGVFQR